MDSERGGRIVSLRAAGHELLAEVDAAASMSGGSFPMAPWAGRIRRGRFSFGGDRQMPINLPPHAIHGTVLDRSWTVVDDTTARCAFDDPWPFAGSIIARWELRAGSLHQTLEVRADEPMPVSMGWHPWFRRRLSGVEAELDWSPGHMFERDGDGMPSGRLVDVPPGPWDDCFGGLAGPPVLRWPGVLELEIASTCGFVVVYDEPADTICVEPQTAPPDALNLTDDRHRAAVVEPGEPLVATTTWTWRRLDG
ncbi:MAG: aldose 1-epimerase [Actinomycetota bacterium]